MPGGYDPSRRQRTSGRRRTVFAGNWPCAIPTVPRSQHPEPPPPPEPSPALKKRIEEEESGERDD
jgi:hypothetical protein